MLGLTLLLSLVASTLAYYPQGTITVPANGTAIAPGQAFDFTYNIRSDYCLSSYNFTVWLLTSSPSSILSGDPTGHFFGRYSIESYPTNPFPTNPAPDQLVMPDFSQNPGGFASGASATNATVYLAVIEEWNACGNTFGNQLSLAANSLVYNATTTTTK